MVFDNNLTVTNYIHICIYYISRNNGCEEESEG